MLPRGLGKAFPQVFGVTGSSGEDPARGAEPLREENRPKSYRVEIVFIDR